MKLGPFVVSSDRERIRLDTLCGRAAPRGDLGAVADTLMFFRYACSLWLGFDQFSDPRPEDDTPPDDSDTESPANC